MTITDKIFELLKKENLTSEQISKKLKVKKEKVYSPIRQLKKAGKIKVIDKDGRSYIYSAIVGKVQIEDKSLQKDKFDLIENPQFIDSLIFSFITSCRKPTYSKIKGFFVTLGIIDKNLVLALLRNLEKDLLYLENIPDDDYSKVLNFLIANSDKLRMKYPLTMDIQNAYMFFRDMGIKSIENFVKFMKNLSIHYPEFIFLSSSHSGHREDLFTIKQIFLDQIEFMPSGSWSVS